LELILKNKPEEKRRLEPALQEFAREHNLPAKVLQAVDLALVEHLTNVMTYGYEEAAPRDVRIRLTVDGGWVQVEVEDDGRPFNPLAAPRVDTSLPLEEKPVGGLGIHIIRQFMDELDYHRTGGKNILRMRKQIV
jgi:serine/threonine-protein kinase RsbW